jgi:hypothetical protein
LFFIACATSEYFEQRGYRILEYSFEDNGTLVIIVAVEEEASSKRGHSKKARKRWE